MSDLFIKVERDPRYTKIWTKPISKVASPQKSLMMDDITSIESYERKPDSPPPVMEMGLMPAYMRQTYF